MRDDGSPRDSRRSSHIGSNAAPIAPQQQSKVQQMLMQINMVDERLSDARTLTDTKFSQLDEQLNVIERFIEEDKEFRE